MANSILPESLAESRPERVREHLGAALGTLLGRYPKVARTILRTCEVCRVPGAGWALALFDA